jgi:DNA-damage-inducible protein J
MATLSVVQPRYNAETEAAMQETRDIISGKVKAKSYASMAEIYAEIAAEPDED